MTVTLYNVCLGDSRPLRRLPRNCSSPLDCRKPCGL